MNGSTRALLVAALLTGTAGVASAQAKEQYDANCKKCHGVAGVPAKAMVAKYPKLAAFDAAFFAKFSDDSIHAAILNGTENMKPFKEKLTADDAKAITAYIKEFAKQ